MNKTILALIAIIIVATAGYFAFGKDNVNQSGQQAKSTSSAAANSTLINGEPPSQVIEPPMLPPIDPNLVTAEFSYKKDSPYEPQVIKVQEGQKVVLKVTADIADEAHLHGYNVSKPTKPGEQVVLELTAKKSGRFELELEKIKKPLGYLEIYPK
jgi:heme/copper-type cytochrome/quinol oxidase subunit 2